MAGVQQQQPLRLTYCPLGREAYCLTNANTLSMFFDYCCLFGPEKQLIIYQNKLDDWSTYCKTIRRMEGAPPEDKVNHLYCAPLDLDALLVAYHKYYDDNEVHLNNPAPADLLPKTAATLTLEQRLIIWLLHTRPPVTYQRFDFNSNKGGGDGGKIAKFPKLVRLDYDVGNRTGFEVADWTYMYLTLAVFYTCRDKFYDCHQTLPLELRDCAETLTARFGIDFAAIGFDDEDVMLGRDSTWRGFLSAFKMNQIWTYVFNILDTLVALSSDDLRHFSNDFGLEFEVATTTTTISTTPERNAIGQVLSRDCLPPPPPPPAYDADDESSKDHNKMRKSNYLRQPLVGDAAVVSNTRRRPERQCKRARDDITHSETNSIVSKAKRRKPNEWWNDKL